MANSTYALTSTVLFDLPEKKLAALIADRMALNVVVYHECVDDPVAQVAMELEADAAL